MGTNPRRPYSVAVHWLSAATAAWTWAGRDLRSGLWLVRALSASFW
ncbi:hypothetical protein P3T29_002588 [Kitasatospora sp. MAP5-34]|nr:hypothetical protein [Kitasatospora sp. MAP5-34]